MLAPSRSSSMATNEMWITTVLIAQALPTK